MPAEPRLREARWVPSILRASLPSGLPVPAGSLSGSIAAPASGSRSGSSSARHCCRRFPIPSGPLPSTASLPPASGFLFGFLAGHRCPARFPFGSPRRHLCPSRSPPPPIEACASPAAGLRFLSPEGVRFRRVQRESGSGASLGLCLTLLPSSPCRCCAPAFVPCGPPAFALPLQSPGAFFRPGLSPLASGRSRPRGEAVRLSDSRIAQSACG